jgi:hypothetical protein
VPSWVEVGTEKVTYCFRRALALVDAGYNTVRVIWVEPVTLPEVADTERVF